MATRMIVTSQPDVACDVCGRRLLRGEQPDVFLANGRRKMVCELCAPRAGAEGWLRETEQARTLSLSPARPRQGRNPLARWRRPRRLSSESPAEPGEASAPSAQDELEDDASPEVVDGDTRELGARTAPVFAGAPVESLAGTESESVAPDEAQRAELLASVEAESVATDEPGEDERVEEGSWRDAWMFVKE